MNASPQWAKFGKFSAVALFCFAAITFGTQLYDRYFPHSAYLEAKLEVFEGAVPIAAISHLRTQSVARTYELLSEFRALPECSVASDSSSFRKVEIDSENRIDELSTKFSQIQNSDSKAVVTIRNNGTKEARSINIDFGSLSKGLYSLESTNADAVGFERLIVVPELRPGTELVVHAWLNTKPRADTVKLNHPDGVIQLDDASETGSRRSVSSLYLLFLIVVGLAWFAISRALSTRTNKRANDGADQNTFFYFGKKDNPNGD